MGKGCPAFHFLAWCVSAMCLALMSAVSQADVVRDGTIGPGSSVQPSGPHFEIGEDLGELRGGNLFHSFSEFSLSLEESATFAGASSIDNIISRVTGSNASSIDGLLRSTVPGAALYLLNPRGVVFGPNAQLDVQGAFHVGTGDQVQFVDGTAFSADATMPAVLSVAAPETFGFLGGPVGAIEINSSALSSAHDITLAAGTVALTHGAAITTTTQSSETGGDILIVAGERIAMTGMNDEGVGVTLRTQTVSDGDGGMVSLDAPVIELEDGALVATQSRGTGNSGEVLVVASERIELSGNRVSLIEYERVGTGSGLGASAFDEGDGGNVYVEAPIIDLRDGAFLMTGSMGAGSGGALTVSASDRLVLSGTNNEGMGSFLSTGTLDRGDAGRLHVGAGAVEVSDGGFMFTGTEGEGAGGQLIVSATDYVTLSGLNDLGGASYLASSTVAKGDAGGLLVRAPVIELQDGAYMFAGTRGEGAGGDLSVIAGERLSLSGVANSGAFFHDEGNVRSSSTLQATSDSVATGHGGSVFISAPLITMMDGASVATSSLGTGDAGSIEVVAEELFLTEASTIFTATEGASGGHISIHASELISLEDSSITYGVGSGSGGIYVDTEVVVLNDGSIGPANSSNAHRVEIAADYILTPTDSYLTDAATDVVDEDMSHNGVIIDGLGLDGGGLLRSHCDIRHGERPTTTLRAARQPGLPLSPEAILSALEDSEHGVESAEMKQLVAANAHGDAVFRGAMPGQTGRGYGDGQVSGEALRALARRQQAGGDYGMSLELLQAARAHAEAAGDESGVAAALGQAANAYLALGENVYAQRLFNAALERIEPQGDSAIKAALYNDLGNLYRVQQRHGEALDAYARSAEQAENVGDAAKQIRALSNGVRVALEAGLPNEALGLLIEARELAHELAASHAKVTLLIHLAKSAQKLAEVVPDIDRAGLEVAYTDLREAVALSDELGDQRMLSDALGGLAALYWGHQRMEEALYLTRYAQRAAERANAPASLYRWYWQEGKLLQVLGDAEAALQALRRAVAILEESRQETLAQYGDAQVQFRQVVAPVYMDFVDALLQRAAHLGDENAGAPLLKEARTSMELLKAAELRDYFRDECMAELEAKATRLEQVASDAAVIYPILLSERLELLVSFPTGLKRYTVPVAANTVRRAVGEFRVLVESHGPDAQVMAAGQQLYDWLVKPYVHRLGDIETLVFVPDGPLRTLPLAALHDGDDYLIRGYRVVVTPGLALTDPRPLNRESARFLLAGLSESTQEFPALPAVRREIESVRKLFGGRVLLNQSFTLDQFEQALDAPVSVVHIASHARFTGEADSSFLLTYDGRMSMADFDKALGVARFRDQPLELLVLSACQTAAGDGRAALGLAGVGIKAGARSAMGSLWAIQDDASAALMTAFYRNLRNPAVSKAQALQQAQHSMLVDEKFAHPFYWSPYLLINNWL